MIDTHFHFMNTFGDNMEDGAGCLKEMALSDTFFGLDIGTRCDDLFDRVDFIRRTLELIDDPEIKNKIISFIHFSAGIWPDPDAITNRVEEMHILEKYILEFAADEVFGPGLCAIGEGGIDHHWNVQGADHRDENDFSEQLFKGERELFEMQLSLAKKYNLPFIIHSRNGFEDTIDCIKNVGYDNGILHCCSYPLEMVKPFIERGWYVSFSGSVTYTKKSKIQEMEELLRYIPEDRILLETDSPYLSPVPLRGTKNTPLNVKHTYDYISKIRSVDVSRLEETVKNNCCKLFKLSAL